MGEPCTIDHYDWMEDGLSPTVYDSNMGHSGAP